MVISLRAPTNDLSRRVDQSFRNFENGGDSVENKLCWLRSQVIGGDGEFVTPFGVRKLTYADHTATGRCLHFVEDYIIKYVLPFYGT